MDRYLAVALGAALGGMARYAAGVALTARLGPRFPAGTFFVNITGSFLIGIAMTLLTERLAVSPLWRLFLVVGFLGGYTTFSSFAYETLQAVRAGAFWLGLVNVVGSIAAGYAAVWLGVMLSARR